jgi:hypothetical protein
VLHPPALREQQLLQAVAYNKGIIKYE